MKNEIMLLIMAVLFVIAGLINQRPQAVFALTTFVDLSLPKVKLSPSLYSKASKVFFEGKEAMVKELKDLEQRITDRINKANEQTETSSKKEGERVETTVKEEIKNLTLKYNDLLGKMQEQLDKLSIAKGKGKLFDSTKSFTQNMQEIFEKSDKLKAYKEGSSSKARIEIHGVNLFKAADMLTGDNLDNTNGDVIMPTRVPGIIYPPDRTTHVRQVIAQGTTSSNKIEFVQEKAIDNGVAMVAEGAEKPQSDVDFEMQTANVRKIATHLRVSQELLDDMPALASYISVRFGKKLMLKEDQQLLYGTGLGQELEGLAIAASAYVDGLSMSNVNRYDVLHHATTQIRVAEFAANIIMIHPNDYELLKLAKATDGQYLFPWAIGTNQPIYINGALVIDNTAINSNGFLVGDFALGAQVFDRMQPSIEFSNQDRDNFIKNMVTIVIEERLAFPIYRPSAFRYGTFTSALANGSA